MFDDGYPILLPYQARWNQEQAPIAVCEKSRRIGLSWGDAAERVAYVAEGKGNVFYMSYSKEMTETYIGDCVDWVKKFNLAAGKVEETLVTNEREQLLRFRIHFDSGKFIQALPSNPRSLRSKGKPGDIVIIDEAAFCDDLEELLKAATAVTQWGGKVRIISTHNGDDNPFNELVRDIRAGRHPYALHRINLDDAVRDGLARRIKSVKGEPWQAGDEVEWRRAEMAKYPSSDMADEELLCIPRRGGGVYFPRVLIESRMVDAPVLRFHGSADFNALPEISRRAEMRDWLDTNLRPLLLKLNPERRHVFGLDFARSGDMTSAAPLEIGETLKRSCPFLFELKNVPHMQQLQAICYLCDGLPRFSGGAVDAGGNGAFLAEALQDRYGSVIEAVTFSESWYRENMPPYKAAYEDDKISIPRHDDILSDHRAIRLVRGVPRLPAGKTDRAGERHGDSVIAFALGWRASESDAGPIEFQRAGRRTSADLDGYLGGPGRDHMPDLLTGF